MQAYLGDTQGGLPAHPISVPDVRSGASLMVSWRVHAFKTMF
jgi:hypothetical protein